MKFVVVVVVVVVVFVADLHMSLTYLSTSPERATGLGPSHGRIGNDGIEGESGEEGVDNREDSGPRGDSCLDRHSDLLVCWLLLWRRCDLARVVDCETKGLFDEKQRNERELSLGMVVLHSVLQLWVSFSLDSGMRKN